MTPMRFMTLTAWKVYKPSVMTRRQVVSGFITVVDGDVMMWSNPVDGLGMEEHTETRSGGVDSDVSDRVVFVSPPKPGILQDVVVEKTVVVAFRKSARHETRQSHPQVEGIINDDNRVD